MTVYTQVFGGNTIYPSDVSYLALSLSTDVVLQWPLEANVGNNLVARIIDVTPTGSHSVFMPDAMQTGVGQVTQFKNVGGTTFTVRNNAGGTLLSIAPGLTFTLYLTDNTTVAGTWNSFQAGASTAQAQASQLAGYGLVAQGSLLSQSQAVTLFNSNYTMGAADRSSAYVWNGAVGQVTLPSAGTVGNNWFASVRNNGTGNLTVLPTGTNLINGAASLVLRPGDSATLNTDGLDFYTIGLGQDPVFAFDYTSINLTGQSSPYTLSGAELNRIAYDFVGTLTTDMVVIIPPTTQQYWLANDTSGAYTLSFGTASQIAPLPVAQGARGIYYCNGADLVKADTASIATPISIADGGTGATTASGARINLGGTSVGIGVFTAVTAANARAAIGGAASGANSDITSLTGLTTPLAVSEGGTGATTASGARANLGSAASGANSDITSLTGLTTPLAVSEGGTGQSSFTNGQLLIGNTTGNTLTKASLTAGSGVSITPGAGSITIAATGSGGTVTSVTAGTGLSGGTITGSGTISLDVTNANNWTGKQTFTGSSSVLAAKIVNAAEKVTVSATAATGTVNYDVTTQSVLYYTSDAAGNWTTNLRASSGTSLDTALATGESATVAFLVKQGAAPFYNSAVQVDGTTSGVTTVWQGGTAPTAGNASSLDVYTYTVIKTGSAAFTVLASLTKFG